MILLLLRLAFADPSALADEAVAANPGLEAMRAHVAGLREQAKVAGAWSDPVVGVSYTGVLPSLGLGHMMAGIGVEASFMLSPPGWSRRQREVGDLRAETALHDADEMALALRAEVHATWWTLARTRLLADVTRTHVERADELLGAVRARYEVGAVGQGSVLRLEVLRGRLADDVAELERSGKALSAALIAVLSRDDGGFDTPAAVVPVPPPPDADWTAIALAHRPALARLDAERRSAEAMAGLARLEGLPEPMLRAGTMLRVDPDDGADLVMLGLDVPLPTGSARRARGERAMALWTATAAEARRQAALDGVRGEMARVILGWRRAWEQSRTWEETLIPTARLAVEVTLSDFRVGKADFAELYEAEVELLDLERGTIVAAVETRLMQAEALAILGVVVEGE